MLKAKIIHTGSCVGATARLKSHMQVWEYIASLPFALYSFEQIIQKMTALEDKKSFLPISACLLFSSRKA